MDKLLQINPGLLIWTIVTFLLLVLVLWKFVWGAVLSGLDQRADRIEGDLTRAEKAKADAEAVLAQYKEQMKKSKEEAALLMQETREKAEENRKKMLAAAQKDADNYMERAKAEIDQAKKVAMEDLQSYMADVVVAVSQKVIGSSLDEKTQKDLIRQSIQQFANARIDDVSH